MKTYDFKYIKRYIQMHSDVIDNCDLGIKEDWFWTGNTVYEEGKFTVNLDDPELKIASIRGSVWGTPVMKVTFKSGEELFKDAYTGESDGTKPASFDSSLGVLSKPVQDAIDEASAPKKLN